MRASYFLLLGTLLTGTSAQDGANSTVPPSLSPDAAFDVSLQIMMSLAGGGGSATSEVWQAATQIKLGDFESYYAAFKYLADGIHDAGASVNATRFPASARESFFRSAAYYRAADFYLHGNPNDTRLTTLWESQLADFKTAISLLDIPGEMITLKSPAGFDIPVTFYAAQPKAGAKVKGKRGPACAPEKVPTVLVGSGYDGTQQDMYHAVGVYVLARGWNFATYEGPGQQTVRRQQGIGFRPDWWTVVTPVVDYLVARDDVDAARIALQGVRFGAVLAPRAASREHRLAALILLDSFVNLQPGLLATLGPQITGLFETGNKTLFDAEIDIARRNTSTPSGVRWFMDQGTWAFGTTSPFEFIAGLANFTLDQAIADNITAPVWVGSVDDIPLVGNQSAAVAKLLGAKATLVPFRDDLGAGQYAQMGAEVQAALSSLDWLADVFDAVKD